jgi:hypothetical protein
MIRDESCHSLFFQLTQRNRKMTSTPLADTPSGLSTEFCDWVWADDMERVRRILQKRPLVLTYADVCRLRGDSSWDLFARPDKISQEMASLLFSYAIKPPPKQKDDPEDSE